jgi:hypothetical protein
LGEPIPSEEKVERMFSVTSVKKSEDAQLPRNAYIAKKGLRCDNEGVNDICWNVRPVEFSFLFDEQLGLS